MSAKSTKKVASEKYDPNRYEFLNDYKKDATSNMNSIRNKLNVTPTLPALPGPTKRNVKSVYI